MGQGMDHTARARRSDALYHDATVGRRRLCDMVSYAEAERDRLRALCAGLMAEAETDARTERLAREMGVRW